MELFINTFPPGASFGSFTAGVGPVGVAPQPAAAGEITFPADTLETLELVRGMLPLRIEVYSGGGSGGQIATAAVGSAGAGGGGGGFASAVVPEGLFAYGSALTIKVNPNPVDSGSTAGSNSVRVGGDTLLLAPGGSPAEFAGPGLGGTGGGVNPAYPFITFAGLVQVVTTNGGDGDDEGPVPGGNGGHGAGPLGGAGGAGSSVASGGNGFPLGGGGGGVRDGGGRTWGRGAGGQIRVSWPAS